MRLRLDARLDAAHALDVEDAVLYHERLLRLGDRGFHGALELSARSGPTTAAPTVDVGLLDSVATAATPRRGNGTRRRRSGTVPWQGAAGRSRCPVPPS